MHWCLDYPDVAPTIYWKPGGGVVTGRLSHDTALAYMSGLKAYLEATMRPLIDAPESGMPALLAGTT